MAWPLLSWLTGGVIKSAGEAVTEVGKTFWGSQQERDSAMSAEQLAVLNQYAAEFAARQQRTWWDSFVDGLNRLVRPGLAIGAQAAFIWAAYDPVTFSESMTALQIVPEMMWYLWLTIFAFYFGGRILETMPKTWKIEPRALEVAKEIAAERTLRAAASAANAGAQVSVATSPNIDPTPPPATVVINTGDTVTPAPSVVPIPVIEPLPAEVIDNSQDDVRAVAATIWGEARGETRDGKIAVAWVICNRVMKPGWWGAGYKGVCLAPHQFSCWWDEQGVRVRTVDETDPRFVECLAIANEVLANDHPDPTHGADHYYADTISAPKWAQRRDPTAVIGHHRFFKIGLTGKG